MLTSHQIETLKVKTRISNEILTQLSSIPDDDLPSRFELIIENGQCVSLRSNYFEQVRNMMRNPNSVDQDWFRSDASGFYFVSRNNTHLPLVLVHARTSENVHILLDQSSSMYKMQNAVYSGAREFIEELPDDTMITFTKFASEVTPGERKPKNDILRQLNGDARVAQGMTALYDAIITAINLEEQTESATKTIVVITDGHDTNSRNVRNHAFEACTRFQKNANHRILFMGSTQDAISQAQQIGIPVTRALSIGTSEANMRSAFTVASRNVTRRRSSGTDEFTVEERTVVN